MQNSRIFVSILLLVVIIIQSGSLVMAHSWSDQVFQLEQEDEYVFLDPISIDGDYDFRNSYFTGSGTSEDPYVLSGVRITGWNYCLIISNSSAYIVIRNSYFESKLKSCIVLYNAINIRFEDCIIVNGDVGITLSNSSEIVLSNITCVNLVSGVILIETDNVIIDGCSAFSNQRGLILTNSSNVVLKNNRVFANREYGMYLDQSTENCTIYANEIGWNREIDSDEIHNAFDDGENNSWFNLSISQGNKWSDYNAIGNYLIEGEAASHDIYPMVLSDYTAPFIDPPQDFLITDTSVSYQIGWHAVEEYPYFYIVYREGEEYVQAYWDGGPIVIDIYERQIGSYNYTIVVSDAAGNTAVDTMFSIVVFSMLQGASTEQVIMASIFSVALVGLVIICIKKY